MVFHYPSLDKLDDQYNSNFSLCNQGHALNTTGKKFSIHPMNITRDKYKVTCKKCLKKLEAVR